MCDELKNENKHQAYGSMSNPIDSLIQDKQNADHPAKIQDNAVSLVVPNALSDDNAPSPSSGSRYPKQDPMHNQPPSYPGGGTYIQPYSANQSKGFFEGGKFRSNRDSDGEGFTMPHGFTDDSIRRTFIRKVYLTLSIQLTVTFGIVCLFTFVKEIQDGVQKHPWLYYLAYGVFLVVYITLMCCEGVRRKSPQNIVLLCIFTLALSYLVGTIASFYTTKTVVVAIGITAVVCFSVTIFSIQTKFDFTKCGGLLFVLCMVLFLFGIITIFTFNYTWYVHVIYGALGALVFTLFLAYDTQMIMGGRSHEISPEEYIFGALTLYIDVVYLFLFILSLVGDTNN